MIELSSQVPNEEDEVEKERNDTTEGEGERKLNLLNANESNNKKGNVKYCVMCVVYLGCVVLMICGIMLNYAVTKDNLEMIPFVHVSNEEICADKFMYLNECIEESKVNINRQGTCVVLSEKVGLCYEQAKMFKKKCFLIIGEYKQCCAMYGKECGECNNVEKVLEKCGKPYNEISLYLMKEAIKTS
jgi:hypothetical protein